MLATSLLWALAWAPCGLVVALNKWADLGAHLSMPWSWPPFDYLARHVVPWTAWGALNGAVFAIVLAATAQSRSLDELSVRRTAMWGAASALTLPAFILGMQVAEDGFGALHPESWMGSGTVLFIAALGAGLAAGTLALAQRPGKARDGDPVPDNRRPAT